MSADLRYGGFWRRFGALWLDVLFQAPLTVLVLWADSCSRLFSIWYCLPGLMIGLVYNVYLVKRFGGTPGKLVAGLRIAKVDGSKIGYREAFLRYLPEFVLGSLLTVALMLPTMAMTDAEYLSLGFMQRSLKIVSLAPSWYRPVQWLQNIWVWGEFLVLLTNKKRRAIHDFIAGTVVLIKDRDPSPDPTFPPVLIPAGQDPGRV
jgi:uncharacterized RDD family membrane protein YckC